MPIHTLSKVFCEGADVSPCIRTCQVEDIAQQFFGEIRLTVPTPITGGLGGLCFCSFDYDVRLTPFFVCCFLVLLDRYTDLR